MHSAGWIRRAHQMVKELWCFSLFLCWVDASMWHPCDNGKLWLEKDLPLSTLYRCAGKSWSESIQKLPSSVTSYPVQPAMSVCMQTLIRYNHTIPSSGAHRPVGAESGEYLYCPPQRWLHNLQHGATVFLYHPCAPVSERVRLSVLARSCLSSYIITTHYELGADRPFAVVSWGHVLEVSHVTESEVCNWLELNAANSVDSRKLPKQHRQKYSLYLTQPAGGAQQMHTGERSAKKTLPVQEKQQSLKRCCEEALSQLRGEGDKKDWNRWKKRRRRSIFSQEEGQREKSEEPHNSSVNNEVVRERMNKEKNPDLKQREAGVAEKIPQDDLGGQQKDGKEPQKSHNNQRDSQTQGAVGSRLGSIKERGERWEKQEKRETSREQRYRGHESELHRADGHPEPKPQAQNLKLDSSEAPQQGGPGCCKCEKTEAPAEGAVLRQRLPTPRTDEAVWAAAALGFLLVLLALSVLHTRLYQHWQTMPSMYWHHPQNDYDSVADVRRRLKMSGGKKKRRALQSRRLECVLLPSSSTEEESD